MEYRDEILDALEKAQTIYKRLLSTKDDSGKTFDNVQDVIIYVKESLLKNDIGFFQFIEMLDVEMKKPHKVIDNTVVISKAEYALLLCELDGYEDIAKDIMTVYNITTLANIPATEYHKAREKIKKIKRTQEDYLRKK